MRINNVVSEDYLYPGRILKLTEEEPPMDESPPPEEPQLGSKPSENVDSDEAEEREATSPENRRGDISKIDMIYAHVLEEGKKVNDSLKGVNSKVKGLGKGFLSFF